LLYIIYRAKDYFISVEKKSEFRAGWNKMQKCDELLFKLTIKLILTLFTNVIYSKTIIILIWQEHAVIELRNPTDSNTYHLNIILESLLL
jgi:hypothetical protein